MTTSRFQHHIEHAATEFPSHVDEFDHVPWSAVPSQLVAAPSIAEAPVRLECRVHDVFDLGAGHGAVKLVIGEVLCVVADPEVVVEGMWVDSVALGAVGRLGGREYVVATPESMYSEQRVARR